MFVKANKNTTVRHYHSDVEMDVPIGFYLFEVKSDRYTDNIDKDEIALYHPSWSGIHVGEREDWDGYDPHSRV